jgi:hypothetical protein
MSKSLTVGIVAVCSFSAIISFALGSYTCTDGSFDYSVFDGSLCFTWPEKNSNTTTTTTTTTNTGGGGGSVTNPALFTRDFVASAHFSECDGAVAITKECREELNGGKGKVGIRWNTHMCGEHVSKFAIDIFSSADTNKRYRYITEVSPNKNSIIIELASSFYKDHNMTIIVTPLDQYNKKISTGTEVVLDKDSTYETCDSIGGTPVDFSWFKEVTDALPAPVDCAGGTWSAPGSCMGDDGNTVLTGEPGKCGAGITKSILTGYTAAQNGGTCKTESGTRCYVPCESAEPADCVLAKYPHNHPTMPNQVAWNPAPGTPDFNYMCCNVEPKGKIFQSADIFEDAQGETGKCQYTQESTCSCP